MKEKFLQFFTGKMSKSIYISIAAAVVCGAVVITSVVVVHDKNKKMDAVLESLSASESVTESVTETVTESVPVSDNTKSQPQAKAANDEPAGDKALQYLAEYDKLTAEYEAKRAELEKELRYEELPNEPLLYDTVATYPNMSDEEYRREKEKMEKENERFLSIYKSECESVNAINQHTKEIETKITTLDTQYEKDVAALKARYGIA